MVTHASPPKVLWSHQNHHCLEGRRQSSAHRENAENTSKTPKPAPTSSRYRKRLMLRRYARHLAGHVRTAAANRHLGFFLAFIAGATYAFGLWALLSDTLLGASIVMGDANQLAWDTYDLIWECVGGLLFFVSGVACAAAMSSRARQLGLHGEHALPLLLGALCYLCIGILGAALSPVSGWFVAITVMLLCFTLGLQNAVISGLSNGEIRTANIVALLTGIGIEMGDLSRMNGTDLGERPKIQSTRGRLWMLIRLAACFLGGAGLGALGFMGIGYGFAVPLALAMIAVTITPVIDDLVHR